MLTNDLMASFRNWRLIHLLGVSNLRSRYYRSKLGQIWLSISLLIQIGATGVVWSVLWHLPIREFLPYLAVSQTIYQFFVLTIQDATNIFTTDSRLYINQKLPFSTSILSSLYKNIIIFLHNLPIIIVVLLWANKPFNINFGVFAVLPFVVIFLTCSSYAIACVCTRYRDVIQIVTSLLNISFLVTPIVWKLSYVPEYLRSYFFLNPLTCFLEVIRNPLLGMSIDYLAYLSIAIWTFFSLLVMTYLYNRFEKRIIFWI